MMGNPGPNYCVLMKQELGKNTFTVWLGWRSYRLPQPVKPHDLRIRKFEKVPECSSLLRRFINREFVR
jgi:hypothetical protein